MIYCKTLKYIGILYLVATKVILWVTFYSDTISMFLCYKLYLILATFKFSENFRNIK